MHKVFVYGTLREDKSKKAPPFCLNGYKLFEYPSGNFPFPYITKTGDGGDVVFGELLTVDDEQLALLDKYESVDRGLYSREEVTIQPTSPGHPYQRAFVYVEASLHPKEVKSGNWFRR